LLKGNMPKSGSGTCRSSDLRVEGNNSEGKVSLVIRGKTARTIRENARRLSVDQQLGILVLAAALQGGAQ